MDHSEAAMQKRKKKKERTFFLNILFQKIKDIFIDLNRKKNLWEWQVLSG